MFNRRKREGGEQEVKSEFNKKVTKVAKSFNAIDLLQGYKPVCIVNPLELIYGSHDEDL